PPGTTAVRGPRGSVLGAHPGDDAHVDRDGASRRGRCPAVSLDLPRPGALVVRAHSPGRPNDGTRCGILDRRGAGRADERPRRGDPDPRLDRSVWTAGPAMAGAAATRMDPRIAAVRARGGALVRAGGRTQSRLQSLLLVRAARRTFSGIAGEPRARSGVVLLLLDAPAHAVPVGLLRARRRRFRLARALLRAHRKAERDPLPGLQHRSDHDVLH